MFRVCLMGAALDTGNMGVSALAASLVSIIRKLRPDAELFFFIGNRSCSPHSLELDNEILSLRVVNYRLSPRAHPSEHLLWLFALACLYKVIPIRAIRKMILRSNPRLCALLKADFIGDIRGGDSFSDIYGLRNFLSGSIPSLIALLLEKDLVLLPQTYGPYQSNLAKRLAGFIMARASSILSRDRRGLEVVKELLGERATTADIRFCPDVAFCLDPKDSLEPPVSPPLPREGRPPLIGFNVSGLLYNGGFTRNNMFGLRYDYKHLVINLSQRMLRETDAHLLFVPHTFAAKGHVESDPDACDQLATEISLRYGRRVHSVTAECDQSRIKGIIGKCDFFIGSRMHSCIASLSQGIPTIGIGYSRKFLGVFDSIGVRHMVLDAREVDETETIEAVLKAFKERDWQREVVMDRICDAQNLLISTFRSIL